MMEENIFIVFSAALHRGRELFRTSRKIELPKGCIGDGTGRCA
jgi:hypothetical protein